MNEIKSWFMSIDQLKGVGPKTMQLFRSLGIETIRDLMHHFPFRFEDFQQRDLETVLDQEKVVLVGKVVTPPLVSYFGGRKSRLSFKLSVDSTQVIQVTFFNQPYLKQQIELGQIQAIYGRWQEKSQSLLAMKLVKTNDDFAPVYSTTKGLKQSQIVAAIKQAFDHYRETIEDLVPESINRELDLMPLDKALETMHFPDNSHEKEKAQQKIIFTEFFLYQYRLQQAKKRLMKEKGIELHYPVEELRAIIQTIPFELTHSQKQAINDICRDLLSPFPMNRLLQGDVGSGKTLVAFVTMIACVLAGYQAALMVPTELLAQQHAMSFNRYFEPAGLHAELLTSDVKTKDKTDLIQGIASGRIRLLIGTHALIQEAVQFKSLAYLVIDEQHRFGVGQRQELLNKGMEGYQANVLQMTATPIPRSLAQTFYADLEVSTLDSLPAGRQKIQTQAVTERDIERVYQQMEIQIENGHQVYYVLPLIEASEYLDQVENVQAVFEKLQARFPTVKIGCLHGQLNKEEQATVMKAFKQQAIAILIATTMVEVGVDVPNATVMVIQSAERFGLAQLHQLRGRVGRSHLASYCYLIANPTTDQAKQRLAKMVASQDGFELSRADMEIRGTGDVLGRNQSGLPQFAYGHPLMDQEWMDLAYQTVQRILHQPETLSSQEQYILDQYSQSLRIEI